MRTVEMNLNSSELPEVMGEMRIWLDERRFEPSVFCCRQNGVGVVVRVDFKVTDEAEAFAVRFRGRVEQGWTASRGQDGVGTILPALTRPVAAF